MRLDGRIVIVTGGSSGFGRAIAARVAREGANVVIADLDDVGGKETCSLVHDAGREAELVVGDIGTESGARAAVERALARFGTVDVLVNNAGVAPPEKRDSWDATEESWDRVIRINLKSVYLCARAVIPTMIANGGGSIVNIASNLGAHVRVPGLFGYQVSKAAVSAITRAAARDHIGEGIRINAVSPGASESSMSLLPGETEAEREVRMKEQSPLGRISSAAEIAAAVLYLASDAAGSAVGTDLVIDGGVSA